MPKLSVIIPTYDMPNGDFFLSRCLASLVNQTFKDFEILVTRAGKMAENTNEGIKRAKGEFIKILYMDDYLSNKESLQVIVNALENNPAWLVTGCKQDPGTHTHLPTWNEDIIKGVNTIGSPSVLTIKNDDPLLFDETMTWLLDCDYYERMKVKYGLPIFLNDINVTIGVGEHQSTHLMGEEIKIKEHNYMQEKYQ